MPTKAPCKFMSLQMLQTLASSSTKQRADFLEAQGFKYHSTLPDGNGVSAIYTACQITYSDGYSSFEQIVSVQSDDHVTFRTENKENFMQIRELLFKTTKHQGRTNKEGEKFSDETFIYSLMASMAAYGIERNHPFYTIGIYNSKKDRR